MHVQSISHWAPANIGPYSQAVEVSNVERERERERQRIALLLFMPTRKCSPAKQRAEFAWLEMKRGESRSSRPR